MVAALVRGRPGVVYTKRWVVELMLDLAGYTADHDLQSLTVIEPAAGDGSFVLPMIERLVESCRLNDLSVGATHYSLRAFELNPLRAAIKTEEREGQEGWHEQAPSSRRPLDLNRTDAATGTAQPQGRPATHC